MSSLRAVKEPIAHRIVDPGTTSSHPRQPGHSKHGIVVSTLRMLSFITWFMGTSLSIHVTQLLGSPLYFINKDYFYAYMALTKQSFGIVATVIQQWFTSTTTIIVSGDESVRGQLSQNADGRLVTHFPERLVLIANHQIYTEWLYLWWTAYTSRMHGHIYIILKESLKWIPVAGLGMRFYGFIYMARNWEKDKPRLKHRLQRLKARHHGPLSGTQTLDPMWLLIFPEGTNLSANTRRRSAAWAKKTGLKDFEHVLLPRALGLHYCLTELKGTVDWIYDCTIGYEGIPRGAYGQDVFPLYASFFQGRAPKSVSMYWRRIAVASVPLDDMKSFELWLRQQWQIKEDLLAGFIQNGRFPADDGTSIDDASPDKGRASGAVLTGAGLIETKVKLVHWYELGQIFVVLAAFALFFNILAKVYNLARYGSLEGLG